MANSTESSKMPATPESSERPTKRKCPPESSPSVAECAAQFLQLLIDDDIMEAILNEEDLEEPVTDRHKEAIDVLHHHFVKSSSAPAATLSGRRKAKQPATTTSSKHGRKAKATDEKGSWPDFKKISQLKVPAVITDHIDQHGIGAYEFLNQGTTQQEVKDLNGKTLKDIFETNYNRTTGLTKTSEMSRLTSLFYMLLHYDICHMLQPNINDISDDTSLLADIITFIGMIAGSEDGTIDTAKAAKDVKRWFELGAKLNIFVDKFGPGCLFILGNHMSDSFIKSKTKMLPKSGLWYGIAMRHMTVELQMATTLRKHKFDKLGENVREFLLRPYKTAYEKEQEGEEI